MSSTLAKQWKRIFLDPFDVLLFRDGRPFDATNRVLSGLPAPQTVAGALRTALLAESGFSFSKIRNYQGPIVDRLRDAGANPDILDAKFRGPWLAGHTAGKFQRLLPCPKNLRPLKKNDQQWMVALPQDPNALRLEGWQHADGLWPLQYPDQPQTKFDSVYLTPSGFAKYLQAMAQPSSQTFELEQAVDFALRQDVFGIDHRIGIGINANSLTTLDGELYGVGLLALKPGCGIIMDVELTEPLAQSLDHLAVPIGGEGKLVRLSVKEVPEHSEERNDGNSFHYLATPTFLSACSTPNRPLPPASCGKLIAAASDRPIGVSGWDVARGGPRPNRFAVPAGAVYFFEGAVTDALMEHCSDRAERLQEGWGHSLAGTYAGNLASSGTGNR